MPLIDFGDVVFLFIGMFLAVIICAYLLNPFFWQGLRNSKFFDELKRGKSKQDIDKLVKP